ncbi:MAG: ATP-binding cassette domain-containing protein [Leptospirillum sp.]|jgi:phospholipid/cholesterol/gamma-HCH transport system ATP-binding protein|nr:ATP-binding cassette domain-containing protein [Nitrospiraceae bacterium]
MTQEPLLDLDNATFLPVGSDGPQLSSVTFAISKGDHTYILGKAGSGKSLLVKSIMGLIPLATGRYMAFGRSMKDPDNLILHYIRKKIGLLPENGVLINSLTIRENLVFPLKYLNQNKNERPYERIDLILAEHQMEKIADLYPYQIGVNAQKSIGLLRAMLFSPALLILDDPYEGLDQDGIRLFHQYFQDILQNQHTTILLFSRKPIQPTGIFKRSLLMERDKTFRDAENEKTNFLVFPEKI